MLINVCGPPASGKSFYIKKFIQEHSTFTYIAIDNYRIIYNDEDEAWYQLTSTLINTDNCILESSGISWHLAAHIFSHPVIARRGILTIILSGYKQDFLNRLSIRKKEDIPFKYKKLSMEGLIDVCEERLNKLYPKARKLISDNSRNINDIYDEFRRCILNDKLTVQEGEKKMSDVFTQIKIWPMKKEHKSIKASGSVVISGVARVKFTVVAGRDGVFASMPADKVEKDGETKWYPHISIVDENLRAEFQKMVVDEYNKVVGKGKQDKAGEENQDYKDNVPF